MNLKGSFELKRSSSPKERSKKYLWKQEKGTSGWQCRGLWHACPGFSIQVSPPQAARIPRGSRIMLRAWSLQQYPSVPWPSVTTLMGQNLQEWLPETLLTSTNDSFWTSGGLFATVPSKHLVINKPSRLRMEQIWQIATHTPISIKKYVIH